MWDRYVASPVGASGALATMHRKARAGWERQPHARIAVVSEGSFGPHPAIPFLALGDERVLWLDRETGLEIVERSSRRICARMDPTRMPAVERATQDLGRRLASARPACARPGFDVTARTGGRPCRVPSADARRHDADSRLRGVWLHSGATDCRA